MTEQMSGPIHQSGTTESTWTRMRVKNSVTLRGSDSSSADYIFLQYKLCMIIATKNFKIWLAEWYGVPNPHSSPCEFSCSRPTDQPGHPLSHFSADKNTYVGHIRLSISTEMTERMSGPIHQPGTTEFTWTQMWAKNSATLCGSDSSSADYIFLQHKLCMMNNSTQFNLLYIATKTSKSDLQNGMESPTHIRVHANSAVPDWQTSPDTRPVISVLTKKRKCSTLI